MLKDRVVIPFTPPNPEKVSQEGKNKLVGCWFFLCGETFVIFYLLANLFWLNRNMTAPETELFHIPAILIATVAIFISSVTSVFAVIEMKGYETFWMLVCYGMTVVFGLIFLGLEIYSFNASAYQQFFADDATVFYALLGVHAAHVVFGTAWILTLMFQTYRKGITVRTAPKFYSASLFSGFAGIMWVLIFGLVGLTAKMT